MNDIVKLGGILLLFSAIAGGALSVVNAITKPRIELQKKLVLERALTTALPMANKDAIVPVEQDNMLYYKGYKTPDKQDLVGYAFVASGKGYSSTIETMVGVDTTFTITGLSILQQVETPGLGTKIEEVRYGESTPWFQDQFVDKTWNGLAVDKDGGNITSITGATISSRAVTKSIHDGLKQLEATVRQHHSDM
ncbi:RnfABCDGE type electron transport complex subunit G [candidate division KSB1 bacterium]|nr:RnfABCDGE type electron transport complex subunit G [candidate division KSB1 bacterium]